MYRNKTCGELRITNKGEEVTLAGWVQRSRKMGGMTFIDLRDRYGITQLVFNEETDADLCAQANKLGREFVIQVKGTVSERYSKNDKMPTGDIEIIVSSLSVLNASDTPPFTIEENTDGGDDLRMKYRTWTCAVQMSAQTLNSDTSSAWRCGISLTRKDLSRWRPPFSWEARLKVRATLSCPRG